MALTDNLVAFWELEEASGTRSDSAGANHLADNNTVTQGTGKVGNCAQFTGANSESLSIADNAALSLNGTNCSINLWCNMTINTAYTPQFVVKDDFSQSREYGVYYDAAGYFTFFVTPDGHTTVSANATTFGAASTGVWRMVTAVYNGATIAISVNGGTQDTAVFTAGIFNGGTAFALGSLSSLSIYYTGLLDQVGIWKRALDSTDIATLYNGGAGLSFAAMAPAVNTSQFFAMFP